MPELYTASAVFSGHFGADFLDSVTHVRRVRETGAFTVTFTIGNTKLIGYMFKRVAVSLHTTRFNLLKPTGHVMHHQFNFQQPYALPTLYLCVLYLSENEQRLVSLTA